MAAFGFSRFRCAGRGRVIVAVTDMATVAICPDAVPVPSFGVRLPLCQNGVVRQT
jgi:hypothetical protein